MEWNSAPRSLHVCLLFMTKDVTFVISVEPSETEILCIWHAYSTHETLLNKTRVSSTNIITLNMTFFLYLITIGYQWNEQLQV